MTTFKELLFYSQTFLLLLRMTWSCFNRAKLTGIRQKLSSLRSNTLIEQHHLVQVRQLLPPLLWFLWNMRERKKNRLIRAAIFCSASPMLISDEIWPLFWQVFAGDMPILYFHGLGSKPEISWFAFSAKKIWKEMETVRMTYLHLRLLQKNSLQSDHDKMTCFLPCEMTDIPMQIPVEPPTTKCKISDIAGSCIPRQRWSAHAITLVLDTKRKQVSWLELLYHNMAAYRPQR